MNDKELFAECVKRVNHLGVELRGTMVYMHCGTNKEDIAFNSEGFNFGYNIARLGYLLMEDADFR